MNNGASKPNTNRTALKTKAPSKKSQLIKLLGTKAGADIHSISEQLGWQQHTTRAAMSGLRKAGYVVVGAKPAKGGSAKFRIVSAPDVPQATSAGSAVHGA